MLLAKSIQILHTSGTMSWSQFGNLLDAHHSQGSDAISEVKYVRLVRTYRSVSSNVQALLARHYRTACTDKRDRIYGMLGLLDSRQDLLVDYKEPQWIFSGEQENTSSCGTTLEWTCYRSL